ncbi:hypothetical protein PRZ48_012631 [Zasmidium cellare]|uniref:Zn(2)-C6 fungal-type domain-containing protein n=1 Tax=Zasmidium cellare TaxID=395010 RepID=A0ABR0E5P7_ZASCE|nr:hypothetical protein PRZ48_012631 [Zasmidium cellare]
MPPQRTADRPRPRQDPVSCSLCRVKKLKCDRQKPCSNCSSRRVTCEYQGERHFPLVEASHEDDDLRAENRIIKARLERLEQTVYGSQSLPPLAPLNYPSTSTAASTPPRPRTDGEKAEEDSHWLESIGTRSELTLPQFAERLHINIQTEEQIAAAIHTPRTHTIDMPPYHVAVRFLNVYAENLDAMQHVLHVEHTRNMVDRVYTQIQANDRIDPGALALILSICASVGLYWMVGFHRGPDVFGDQLTANKVSTEWSRQALYAIEQVRVSTTETSLEAVQACIMLTFLFYHVEGFTVRVRMMHSTAIAMARDQGLQKLDTKAARTADLTQVGIIEKEVRRKVWWHLSCTDWLLTYIRGPQEGMYSIHPRQVSTNPPRNLTREDLNSHGPDFSRGAGEPTIMSYYLHRIKLAHACRDIVDAVWCYPDMDQVNYDLVASMDAKFESIYRGMPRFLRFDIPSAQLKMEYGDAFTVQMDNQRVMANQMINTMRCKLHLPFLIRAKFDARFNYSRNIGLESARNVFKIRQTVLQEESSLLQSHLKLGGIMLHVFYATVVLVMDICVNKGDDDPQRLVEVREALNIIEQTKEASEMGAQFSDSLLAVLRKHHVKLPNANANTARANDAGQSMLTTGNGYMVQGPPQQQPQQINGTASYVSNPSMAANAYSAPNGGLEFDGGMWQDFIDQGQMLDTQDWEALLQDLDMHIL